MLIWEEESTAAADPNGFGRDEGVEGVGEAVGALDRAESCNRCRGASGAGAVVKISLALDWSKTTHNFDLRILHLLIDLQIHHLLIYPQIHHFVHQSKEAELMDLILTTNFLHHFFLLLEH